MFQLSFIRAEGVQDPCEVHLQIQNQKQLGKFEETLFSVPKSVHMRISLISLLNKSLVSSASFCSDLLPTDSFQWLPLSTTAQDLFKTLPQDVKAPRVLVYVKYDLSPVKEISESESEDQENPLKTLPSLTNSVETFQILKDLQYFKGKFEKESLRSAQLKDQLVKVTQEFEEAKINAKLREEFLEGLLNDKIKAVKEGKKLESFDDKENCVSDRKSSRVGEKSRVETERIRVKSEKCERGNWKVTHLALQEYMKKKKVTGMFVRESGNVYLVANKKVFITVKNGILLCRVGGGFESIDEFVKKVPNKDLKHKRASTISASSLLRY